ncbi:hypothetical protein L1987_74698 [Smallanthus sonchifolius]|uniref:Uncharacterized protein n=1 Tax=Smallanthus sonchifolius TaxID=185202 RepID=A0ACB9A2X9_9ASTR|nr:hypothetical protein L1987_74698 [Smallanthus sonchifolius]
MENESNEGLGLWEHQYEDHLLPMFLEISETMLDLYMEVEMEDVVNIDICDEGDQLPVVEYVEDIYANYRRIIENCSLISSDYMSQQFEIDEVTRAIIIDWLIEVHDELKLQPEALFLFVSLQDRFLAKQCATTDNLQLVAMVAMLLSRKYEKDSVLLVKDLSSYADDSYSTSEILEMEKLMLNTLEYDMSQPTAYVFITRFLKAARSEPQLDHLSFFLIELCLREYAMLKFPPSLLAAASVYTAQCSLYGLRQWSKTCEWYTKYSEDQLLECSRMIVGYHQWSTIRSVYRKYNTLEFGYAARCKPAKFLVKETNNFFQTNNC